MLKSVLVQETGDGWGIALGTGGRFYRIRIPSGMRVGDEFGHPVAARRRRLLLAAAAALVCVTFVGGAVALGVFWQTSKAHVLVTLRSERSLTMALYRQGTVAAVTPRAQINRRLIGMGVEQAVHHAASGLYAKPVGVEVRPGPEGSPEETAAIEARIKTVLTGAEPPITVAADDPGTGTSGGQDQDNDKAKNDKKNHDKDEKNNGDGGKDGNKDKNTGENKDNTGKDSGKEGNKSGENRGKGRE